MTITRYKAHPRASLFVIHENTIYVSGLTPQNPDADIKGQTENVLARVDDILAKAGSSKSKILLVTIYLKNISDYDAMNEVWGTWVDPSNLPSRVTVEAKLTSPNFLIDIAVIGAR
jgi:enamine deaminase RidA (YjgF/YER057c/UK114 family)